MPKNKNSEPNNFDSMKCIWMSSNMVEYKLCDKNFDCDNCVFDKIMRNINPENNEKLLDKQNYADTDIIRKKTNILKTINYSQGYYYLNNSIVLKRLFDKTYYLGLDKSVYLFLDNMTHYEFPKAGSGIKKDEVLLKLYGDWGETEVLSPIEFFIVDKLKHNIEDVRVNAWLSLVEADPDEVNSSQLTEKEYNCNLDHLMLKLYEFENQFDFLGTRMKDGGLDVKFLYQAVGTKKYKEFLTTLLSQKC
jgi:glycine cleavage system H lipoate-binding protein